MSKTHDANGAIPKLLMLVLLFCWPYSSSQAQNGRGNRLAFQTPSLPSGTGGAPWERRLKRTRAVTLDRSVFDRATAKRAMSGTTPDLRTLPAVDMNFFADTIITVHWKKVEQTDDFKSFVWTGAVDGFPLGDAIFVASDTMVTGNVSLSLARARFFKGPDINRAACGR
jgi:hypothetical protein